MPKKVDYSLYLVTDSTMIPEGSDLFTHVEKAVSNGAVTIVQLREKDIETRDFVEKARKLHAITKKYNVPLIINDRVDVALAIDAEGVHVGQDDLDVPALRKLLGKDKIVGVSTHDKEELERAIQEGADYVGIGAVYGTKTKDLKKAPIGSVGVKEVLLAGKNRVPAVAIGGINASNVQKVMYFAASPAEKTKLAGVAVVSAIMANEDPAEAARELKELIVVPPSWALAAKVPWDDRFTRENLLNGISQLVGHIPSVHPLVHHITNNVVKNMSANVTIAIGGSPAMSECVDEFADFASIPNAGVLINMGMPSPEGVKMYKRAGEEYNQRGRAVVFDPVAAGATRLRTNACQEFLQHCAIDVVKGNDGEIFSAAQVKSSVKSHGVDSIGDADNAERYVAASTLAKRFRTVVLMTGPEDLIVDEHGNALIFSNGSHFLAEITGSGCSLGSVVATLIATDKSFLEQVGDTLPYGTFVATAAAIALYTIAAERAADFPTCTGPGTFVPLFIDQLYSICKENAQGNTKWLSHIKVRAYNPE